MVGIGKRESSKFSHQYTTVYHSIPQYITVYHSISQTHRVIIVDPFVCLTLHKLAINEELHCGLWGRGGGVVGVWWGCSGGAVVCVMLTVHVEIHN